MADLPNPADHSEVRLALRRAGRLRVRRPHQVVGLTAKLLEHIVLACPDTLAGYRDAALLSVGYDTLCRSHELVAMQVAHLGAAFATVHVPRSKSDPFGDGRTAYLSKPTRHRLDRWLEHSKLEDGALFRGLARGCVSPGPFRTSSARRLIKRAAMQAGIDPDLANALSGHSMRMGAAQDMMLAGIDTVAIMQAGGWKSHEVLGRYVEHAAAERMHEKRSARLET
ncbi:tyrosine-type recombinase/integrase [Sphingomicrobium astaxanthinifaciens]|uniref:tyrosine-type recombinase/integrase n=1 Tax=Sphingomicrobium astaxanthinifaciens TaxID=1227949 RepID=UPI001FCBF099|nr:tyrosine-type recombinase/integrase [Sphingomicrobium astaxanthinifaciens]MCJ7420402.1 tyrosine-type recombinase/integrase [Sphingomicrobium astaxanthinifaciens]